MGIRSDFHNFIDKLSENMIALFSGKLSEQNYQLFPSRELKKVVIEIRSILKI